MDKTIKIELWDNSLLKELREYRPTGIYRTKAMRIFSMCLKAGKLELAKKIEIKYELNFKCDDMVTAFGFALMAMK